MAKKNQASDLADVPFYDYLWQFYSQNKKRIRSIYTPLTRKFLDFNDPGDDGKSAFLRRPQFEALEMYVFLKEYCDNMRLADIFKDWQERKGVFDGRGTFRLKIGELGLFETIDASKFEAAFSRMKSASATYPNYIYALTMGLGKTILMATCIFYEFLLANKYPKDKRFCHNALVFAPDKTVLQSLKEIQTFDKSKVVPPGYVKWLNGHIKFHFLDDTSLSLQVLPDSEFNIIISNNQKIILKRSHKEKSAGDKLFAAEKKYQPVAKDLFAGLDDGSDEIDTEEDLIANQRFEMLKRLGNLGIYVDEAHHAFGKKLEGDFSDKKETSLRRTINELSAHLSQAGTQVVACYNYTGTPYVNNVLLAEVVYTYSLKAAIDSKYLKKAIVKGYENTKSKEFVKIAIKDFWKEYGEQRVEGMLPKMAIFASDIAELTNDVKPAVEEALTELGIDHQRILVNVGDDKVTTNDDIREFLRLDTASSDKQFILLVNKGKEGWNCQSLFAVALHRKPKSTVFVLQATMRCLRAIGNIQETGRVYLSNENLAILDDELKNNFRLNVDEFTKAGNDGKKRVAVKAVPPPVTVKLKRLRHRYDLREINLKDKVDFRLKNIDPLKYEVIETNVEMERVGRDSGSKKILTGVKDQLEYSPLSLTVEIARYIGKPCRDIRVALEGSVEGMDGVVAAVNKHNEILFDYVIPELFRAFYELDKKTEIEEIELKLVKPPKGSLPSNDNAGGDGSEFVAEFNVKPELLASLDSGDFSKYATKSFHLDNYCFDSTPEFDFFKSALCDEEVEKIYFTGMLTSDKTEFCVSYIDPESNTLRNYYPDFFAKKKDGSYVIVEVKGENKIDDAVVIAKAESARNLASANAMEYLMVPGKMAAYGLNQPKRGWFAKPEVLHDIEDALRYKTFLPLYTLRAACGAFGDGDTVETEGWVNAEGNGRLDNTMFAVHAKGRSMEPIIRDGDICKMRKIGGGNYENKIVLVQHYNEVDSETGGEYSIKRFTRERDKVVLKSLNSDFEDIVIEDTADYSVSYRLIATFEEVIK